MSSKWYYMGESISGRTCEGQKCNLKVNKGVLNLFPVCFIEGDTCSTTKWLFSPPTTHCHQVDGMWAGMCMTGIYTRRDDFKVVTGKSCQICQL